MRSKNINADGVGNGPESDFINRTLEKHRELQFYDSQTVRVEQTTRGTRFHAKIPPAGQSQGVTCKSYNPTKACTAGVFYKLLDSDSIVTTGIVCVGSATAVKATAGKYLCLKSVPALKNDGTDQPYYIPQIPDASGSLVPDDPSGSLAAENANKYWELFTPSQICDGVI